MNFKEIAPKIIACVGGAENIQTHTHCMTRLRLVLADKSKADQEALKAIPGVQGVVDKGGMLQIIIGTSVELLYNEMLPMMPATGAKAPVKENLDGGKKESVISKVFAYISGCITPTLPILVGSGLISAVLANLCVWLTSFGGLSMAVLSALHPLLVMVGMHTVITPLIINEIAATGSSLLFSKALAANLAIAGAALAVGLKAKKAENKQAGLSTGITALLSVTEPALYGCLIRFRKPLISAIVASAITGIFIGIFDVRAFATASCSFLTLPIFLGGTMQNFILACVAAVMATVLGFVITWFVGFEEE